jgi:chromosomal replication initiation ATPase DnaA
MNAVYDLSLKACALAGISHSRMFSRSRTDALCKVRYAVWHLVRQQGWSTPRIAMAAGRKDHGTVLNGLARAKDLLATDPAFRAFVESLSSSTDH